MGIGSRDLVIDKTFKFKKRIDELRSKEYYSEDPGKLINLFEKVIVNTSEIINKTDEEDEKGIRRINILLSFYHLLLDEIEHIEVNNVPVEMLPIFTKILDKLQVKTVFVFRPNPLYNYSYYPVTKAINAINKSQHYPEVEEDYKISVISFPSSEKNSALLHCSFSHEVGHHLNEVLSIANDLEPQIIPLIDKQLLKKYTDKYLESLKKERRIISGTEVSLDKFFMEDQLTSELTELFGGIIRKWLDEIVSDSIALCLFGPAFVFAISEFLLASQDPKKYSESHPPMFIRLKNLMNLFDEKGFSEHLKNHKDVIAKLESYKKISEMTFEPNISNLEDVRNIILERGIVQLFKPARDRIDSKIDFAKQFAWNLDDLDDAVFAFRNLITGNEVLVLKDQTSRPINAITILNAAWIVRINYIDELYKMLSKTERTQVRDILDELTLKSLDLQEFHSRMVSKK
jgi:hypothetical protein